MKGLNFISITVFSLFVFLISKESNASALPANECSGNRNLVVKDSINIDLVGLAFRDAAEGKDCYWTFETDDETRILHFTAENLLHVQEFITIYDGLSIKESKLTLSVNQEQSDGLKSLYTTGRSALVRIDYAKLLEASRTLPNSFNLRIAKAVFCPFNLGTTGTTCARAVDAESCYCAVFIYNTWSAQRQFCQSNNFNLLTIDSKEEEELVCNRFGADAYYWTGANDIVREGFWIWDASGRNLYPWGGGLGYANWGTSQPDTTETDEDCMQMNFKLGWNDEVCTNTAYTICESQP